MGPCRWQRPWATPRPMPLRCSRRRWSGSPMSEPCSLGCSWAKTTTAPVGGSSGGASACATTNRCPPGCGALPSCAWSPPRSTRSSAVSAMCARSTPRPSAKTPAHASRTAAIAAAFSSWRWPWPSCSTPPSAARPSISRSPATCSSQPRPGRCSMGLSISCWSAGSSMERSRPRSRPVAQR